MIAEYCYETVRPSLKVPASMHLQRFGKALLLCASPLFVAKMIEPPFRCLIPSWKELCQSSFLGLRLS